jgi:molybdopterin/thiamine biosynthesis adenylyltransferase
MNTSRKSVLVVGAGGLGCPALWALGASGRRITVAIADGDVVEASNLHRQILHRSKNLGVNKALSARIALAGRFPSLDVDLIPAHVDDSNVEGLIARYHLVLDCTDNFASKLLLNDACVQQGIPLVHGGVIGWSGQLLSVIPDHACVRCLFEAAPPEGETCATAGVVGPLAGLVGALMGQEALAILDGKPQLAGALLAIDGRTGKRRLVSFRPRAGCSACAARPRFRQEVSSW